MGETLKQPVEIKNQVNKSSKNFFKLKLYKKKALRFYIYPLQSFAFGK